MVYQAWNLAKPNRYIVEIPGASTAFARQKQNRLGGDASEQRVLSLNCKGVNMPGVSFSELTHAYSGQYPIDIPTAKTFSKLNMEFYLSENHFERNYFLQWQGDVFNERDKSFNYPDEYKRDITIYQLPVTGNSKEDASLICRVIGVYPKSVSDVQLLYGEVNSVGEFQVSFAFTRVEFLNKAGEVFYGEDTGKNDVAKQEFTVG